MGREVSPSFCRSWGTSGTFVLFPRCLCSLPSVSWPHPATPKDQALSCSLLPCGAQKLLGLSQSRGVNPFSAAALGAGG